MSEPDVDSLLSAPDQDKNLGLLKEKRWVTVIILVLIAYVAGIDMYAQPEYTQSQMKMKHNLSELLSACHPNTSLQEYRIYQGVQRETAQWAIYFSLANLLPAGFVSLLLGPLTDVIGRKFLLALATFGLMMKMVVWTFVTHYDLSLAYVLPGQFISGLTGSMFAAVLVMYAFLADVTAPGKARTLAIVLCELCLGVVISLSSFVTGYFIQAAGFFYPMLAAACLAATSLVLTLVAFPETRRAQRHHPNASALESLKSSFKKISVSDSIKRSVQFYIGSENKIRRCQYILLLMGFMFMIMSSLNRLPLETLYELGSPFCWTPKKVGWFGTLRVGGTTIVGLGILKLLNTFLADDTVAIAGVVAVLISFLFEAFATTDVELYIVALITIPSALPVPMMRSLMSHLTQPDQQGAMFAGVGAMETLCTLLGALTTNAVYSATLSIMNGFVFLILAGLSAISLICLILLFIVRRRYRNQSTFLEEFVQEPTMTT